MWNRWRAKLAGEGLLRTANQTVTDRAAGRTDHRQASGGVAAAVRDVCSGVPAGRRADLARSFRRRGRTELRGGRGRAGPGRHCGLRDVERVPTEARRLCLPRKHGAVLPALPRDRLTWFGVLPPRYSERGAWRLTETQKHVGAGTDPGNHKETLLPGKAGGP